MVVYFIKKENLTKENAVFSSPEAAKIQLAETVDFINRAKNEGIEPSVVGALVYQRLIAYHPFAEGNGRMARVIVNKIWFLMQVIRHLPNLVMSLNRRLFLKRKHQLNPQRAVKW